MRMLAGLCVVLVVGVVGRAAAETPGPDVSGAPPARFDVITVKPADVELRTNATGSLTPRDRTVVPAPITGKVEWVIDEGTSVRKGTEVARIDCTEYVESLEQLKLELLVVEAELRRAKLEEQLVKDTLEFEVKKARLTLERARLRRSVLGPPTPTEEKLAQLAVDQTRFAMEAALREYDRFRKLGEKGIQSGRDISLAKLRHERARADHLKAQADYELLLKGDPKEDIAVADQEARREEINLDLAQKRLKSQADFQATQVRVAEVGVERVRALLDLQQGRIDRSKVTAPVDGVVYYPRVWGIPLRAGDPVWQSNRLLDIGDPAVMTVEAIVSQVDWPRVKPEQDVEVRLVAYPDRRFTGVVRKVGKLARDRSLILREEIANVMSFNVLVDLKEQAPQLRPSYTAKVYIITNRFRNCIALPRGAVIRRDGKDFVWLRKEGQVTLQPVAAGPSDATSVIIESGLVVGDQVLVPVQTSAEKT